MRIRNLSIVMGILLLAAGWSQAAIIYNFKVIPDASSDPANAAAGEEQLFFEISSPATSQVLFSFFNTAFNPLPASITDIYFEDNLTLLASIDSIIESAGVDFGQGASPKNLPRGQSLNPAFETTPGLSFDSESPTQPNGVNPNESLGILFNLNNGIAWNDVITALNEGDMRVGMHVQAFADGGGESFINGNPPPIIPEPQTFILLLTGLGLVYCRLRTLKIKA